MTGGAPDHCVRVQARSRKIKHKNDLRGSRVSAESGHTSCLTRRRRVPHDGGTNCDGADDVLTRVRRSTVLLSEEERQAALAAALQEGTEEPRCFSSLTELLGCEPLSSIGVFVLHSKPVPRGMILVTLGRLNLEYPGMQKVALLEGVPPLPVAEYLASCGVDILLEERSEDGPELLGASLDKLRERTRWVTS